MSGDLPQAPAMRRNPEMEKYVEIRPVIMEGYPDAQHVFLKVANQRFCVSSYGCETKEEAEWMRDMLCIALATIVADTSDLKITKAEIMAIGDTVTTLRRMGRSEHAPTPISLKDMLKTADDLIGIQEDLPDAQDRDVLGRAAHYLRKYGPPVPHLSEEMVEATDLIPLFRDAASVNMTEDAVERQARRLADAVISLFDVRRK